MSMTLRQFKELLDKVDDMFLDRKVVTDLGDVAMISPPDPNHPDDDPIIILSD